MENCQRVSLRKEKAPQPENRRSSVASLWTAGVLELLEFVLRPPEGGPPPFPEHGDSVFLRLDLLYFILVHIWNHMVFLFSITYIMIKI